MCPTVQLSFTLVTQQKVKTKHRRQTEGIRPKYPSTVFKIGLRPFQSSLKFSLQREIEFLTGQFRQ